MTNKNLGLRRLGQSLARETGLPLTRMKIVAAAARLGDQCTKAWALTWPASLREMFATDGAVLSGGDDLDGNGA